MLEARGPQTVASHATAPEPTAADDALAERRHRRLVVFSGCFLVFALVALLMPIPFRGRLWDQIADLLHVPAFAVINYLALSITRYHFPSQWRMPLRVTLAVIAFSAVIEILQGILWRYASLGDLVCNAMGATAALLIHQSRWLAPDTTIRWGASTGCRLRSIGILLAGLGVLRPVLALLKMFLTRVVIAGL